MWNFKGCPRCRGDIFLIEDAGDFYQKCLQCGYERAMVKVASARKELPPKSARGRPVKVRAAT